MDATPEGFQDRLDADLAWRKVELSTLSRSLNTAANKNKDSPEARALARATITLGYAHWEGFSKNALDSYCDCLLRRKLRIITVNDALLIGQGLKIMRKMQSGDSAAEGILAKLLRGEADERLSLIRPEMSDTKSNLRYERLTELLTSLGLDATAFHLKHHLIDVRLCDRRNEVAHGRGTFPDAKDVQTLQAEVIDLMEMVKSLLISAVSNKTYLSS